MWSFLVFLTINVPILYLPTFSGFSPRHDQGFQKRSGYFRRFPSTLRRLLNVADNVRKKKFRRRLRTPKVILKTTILTCFNFVGTQKSTPSKSSFNAFLDWIFIIYHVLRKHFVRICESGVRNCPSCVRSMSLDSLVHRRETYA